MRTRIQKWGNSLAVRIPSQLLKQLQLHPGTVVSIDIEDERLVVCKSKYDLDTMLGEITPQNRHSTLLDDAPKGGEAW